MRNLVIKLHLMSQIATPYCIIHKNHKQNCQKATEEEDNLYSVADKTSKKEKGRLCISFTSKCEEANCLNILLGSTKTLLVALGLSTNVKMRIH